LQGRGFLQAAGKARLGRMHDFTHLLLAASQSLGTLLDVANLLEVEPRVVYRWMAGFDRPSPASVTLYKQRLAALQDATRACGPHPYRRRFDARAA
jgi:hypothetical protein